jgi:mono/diheme cytochrome c family protein
MLAINAKNHDVMRQVLLVFAGCVIAPMLSAAEQPTVDFNRDLRMVLSNNCFQCHGPDEEQRKANLRLDDLTEALAKGDSGRPAIVPGEPEKSELIRRITSPDAEDRMPPAGSGKHLTDTEIQLLTQWVQQGAKPAQHWSYQKPIRPAIPQVNDPSWPVNEIDYFVLAHLEQANLAPSSETDRYALIRRLSLDVTGLPPTWEDAQKFTGDSRTGSVGRLVDRLLAKQTFGEHWARKWLDLARYADSAGYADDPPRTIWAYRDWVIRAVNANLPFDQFTIEQLAGDLLSGATEDQLIATAFHRNTLTNSEGGTDDEEFRNVAVVDRVNTTMAVWMGTTIGCAQCHSHKFDPISQEEYFRVFAILNNTEDADKHEETPVLELWSKDQQQQKSQWEHEVTQLTAKLAAQVADDAKIPPSTRKIFGTADAERSAEQRAELADYLLSISPETAETHKQLIATKQQLAEIKPYTTVPILRELTGDKLRLTHIQRRGNFMDLDKQVTAGFPEVFHSPPDDAPLNRLALARWLVDENNPLTARVIANRYWEAIFGVGLVRTSEEFGAQGGLPSHPQLLDWLATELIRLGWDTKAFLRLLVTSATYRQSSAVTPAQFEMDPDNRQLARGPRFRISAEMIRDQALFVSGLLSDKMYGPPVRPPQPSLGLKAAFGSSVDWEASEGEDRHRRALYTTWRRSSPYPSMATFDAPNREVCTVRRARTNTPLQALVTLNDPAHVEAAQALGRRMASSATSTEAKATHGFRLCLARSPEAAELRQLVALFEQSRQRLANDPDKAQRLATIPLGPTPDGADTVELAAWTVVGNVLLNLDEMFLRR